MVNNGNEQKKQGEYCRAEYGDARLELQRNTLVCVYWRSSASMREADAFRAECCNAA